MSHNQNQLRNDLTFEEFCALANQKPNLEGDWVYRYEAFLLDDDEKKPYPKFDIWSGNRILFHTLAEAEAFMRNNIVKHIDEPMEFYCHTITQIPLGSEESDHGASWLYDPYGALLDYAITSWTGSPEYFHFFGRPDSRIRFRKGDIVEVRSGNTVKLAIVVSHVSTIQDCREIYQRCQDDDQKFRYCQDPSDDQCVIIDGPGYEYHEHVSPLRLMKPRFWVDEQLRREMRGWLGEL